MLTVGTVINVLNFKTILFVGIIFSYTAVTLLEFESETKYLYGAISDGSAVFMFGIVDAARKNFGFCIIQLTGEYLFPKNPPLKDSVLKSLEAILLWLDGKEYFESPDGTYDSPGLKYVNALSVGNKEWL